MKNIRNIDLYAAIFSLLLAGCGNQTDKNKTVVPGEGTGTPVAETTPRTMDINEVFSENASIAPVVVQSSPAFGEVLALDGTIGLTFDQPMNTDSVESAWQLQDNKGNVVQGSFVWQNDQKTIVFTPQTAFVAGDDYQLTVDEQAQSAQAVALDKAYEDHFYTRVPVQVSQVFPEADSVDVEPTSQITVIFNQPVVPLGITEEQQNLIQPLTFTPAVAGTGSWINTSVYVFQPSEALFGGTEYKVSAQASTDAGQPVGEPLTWSFTTLPPSIESIAVDDNWIAPPNDEIGKDVSILPKIQISFFQPMETASVEKAVHLVNAQDEEIPLRLTWNADTTVINLTPKEYLLMGQYEYRLVVDADARAKNGGTLGQITRVKFQTIAVPAINSISQYKASQVLIKFASEMDQKRFESHLKIEPRVENLSFFYNGQNNLILSGFLPSTTYTITVFPGLTDIFGNAINTKTTQTITFPAIDPYLYLVDPGLPQYRLDGPKEIFFRYSNIHSVDVAIYKLSLGSFLNSTIRGVSVATSTEEPVEQWRINLETPLNVNVLKKMDLTDGGNVDLEPGYYYLTIDSEEINSPTVHKDGSLFMVATDSLNLKVSDGNGLAWVTGLTDGKPVSGSQITILNDKQAKIASGKTDADGLFAFDLPEDYQNETLFAYDESDNRLGYSTENWYSGISPYDFGLWATYYSADQYDSLTAYVYTDRPLYRPDQPVYFKGVVRNDRDMQYSLPQSGVDKVLVTVSNYETEIYRKTLPLSEFGTFNAEFNLDADTTLGSYYISVYQPGHTDAIGTVSFSVAEYRKPEFIVDVTASPKEITMGDDIQANVASSYYSGGGVNNAYVSYYLTSMPYTFSAGGDFKDYSFDDVVKRYYDNETDSNYFRTISEGEGYAGQDGKFTTNIPTNTGNTTGSLTLTLDASVSDVTGNVVSGQAQVIAHASSVYAGVKSAAYVGTANEPQQFDLAAVDWDGQPVAGQTLSAVVYKLEWYSVKKEDATGVLHWEYSSRQIPVEYFYDLKTDEAGLASITFTPTKGGTYFARVTAADAQMRKSQASAMMWISSKEYVSWQQKDDRTFDVVLDQDSYLPGDEAKLLIASPYQGTSYALVTVERGLIRSQQVLELTNNSTIVTLPITKDMAPTVYVSVLVVKGVDETNPYPDFKMSMAAVNVSTEEQQLSVSLQSSTLEAGPGDEVTYDVSVTDAQGKPASAEVSLGLTDLSVLALMDANAPAMLDYFYNTRGLAVQTSIPITHNIEAYNASMKETVTEGAMAGSGGGKGGGEFGVEQIRQNFPDTPFWMPDAVTDADGNISVTVTLPDNLTTWRMDARAVTKDTEAGQKTMDIISTKPLLLRPQTPRFFVAGDLVMLGTAVHNNTEQDLEAKVSLEASGVDIVGDAEQTVNVLAGQQVYVTWQVQVQQDTARADFVFRVNSGNYSDASLPTLGTLDNQGIPVYRYEVRETVSTSGAMSDAGQRTETIQLPQNLAIENGELDITVEPSLLAGMQAGLNYLEHYQYECNEQTVSRFLPNILTYNAMKAAGMQDAELESNLETQVNLAVQRLTNAQRSDGGWGWWASSDTSQPLTSAYVVFGLWEADQAGYTVSKDVLSQGKTYLQDQINQYSSEKFTASTYKQNTLAFMLYVMARMDQPMVSQTVQLFDKWQYLSYSARAYLAYTLYSINPNDARIQTLKNDMVDSASLSASGAHWEETSRDIWNWGSDTRTTAVVLDTMIRIDPQNPLTANAVRWLMRNRTAGHWASTQETAWTLISLTDWMQTSGDLTADYGYGVKFNEALLSTGEVNKDTLEDIQTLTVKVADFVKDGLNHLTFARTDGSGNLYYSADLNVYLPVPDVKALDQGIVISRKYFEQGDLKTPVENARQGDMLVVQLTIVVPQAVHYLLVEDMLPAGTEAIDTSLKTSASYYGDLGLSSTDGSWGWWYFEHSELHDEKVVLSAEYLPAGTYTYTYLVRATFPGTYNVIPPVAQEFYFPDVYGRGDGSTFTVLP